MNFHLAIPAANLKDSANFYKELGGSIGRVYPTHAVMKFYGVQLVLHQSDLWARAPEMYPRHFGIIVESKAALEQLWNNIKDEDYVFEELFGRHIGKREEHWTFFLKDPSNNLVEFKWYKHEEAIFTSKSLNKP